MSCLAICIQPSPTNAHCGACHVTFGSVTGFDRHRRAGECLDPATLAMHRDARGIWRMDGSRPVPVEPCSCGDPDCPWNGADEVLDHLSRNAPLIPLDSRRIS